MQANHPPIAVPGIGVEPPAPVPARPTETIPDGVPHQRSTVSTQMDEIVLVNIC
jgi:hypothetical protein